MKNLKTRKNVITLLDEFYLKHSSNIFFYKNQNNWPLYRIQLGYLLNLIIEKKNNPNPRELKLDYKQHSITLKNSIHLLYCYIKNIVIRIKFNNNNLLVYGFKEHFNLEDDKLTNPYITPFVNEIKQIQISYNELIVSNKGAFVEKNKLNELFSYLYSYNTKLFEIKNIYNKFNDHAFSNAKLVKTFLEEKNIEHSEYLAYVIYHKQIEQEILYNTFKDFLKITKPKLIWTYCYYDNNVMALCRAANELSINNVEYQHSVISDEHFAYAKWNNIDDYMNFFPKTFWTWTKNDADKIIKNFSNKNGAPNVVIGGNISLFQEKKKFNYKLPESNNSILVSLQGNWIPNFVENVISQDSVFTWFFRLHPRYVEDKALLEQFKKKFPYKIQIANDNSLYELFTKVKINITDFSGVAIEASLFNVNNIIVGEKGFEIYKQEISDGFFHSAVNESELHEKIYFLKEKNSNVNELEYDVRQNIIKLLNGSGVNN